MRIPLDDRLGNRVADNPGGPRPQQGDGGIGAAGQRIGDTIQRAAFGELDVMRRDEERQKLIAQRAQAALTLAETNNELHDAHDEVARGVLDGSVPTDKAETEFASRAAKVRDERFRNLSEEQRGAIGDNLVTSQGALSRNLRGTVIKRQQAETGTTIDTFGEQTARDALRIGPAAAAEKFDAFVDFAAGGAGWSPEVAAKKKQAFRESAHYSFFDQKGEEALQAGDVAGLGKVLEAVKGKYGEPLDPQRRTQLQHQLYGYQQSILAREAAAANKAQAEAEKRERVAEDTFNKGFDISLSGGQFSPEFIKSMTTQAAGTTWEGAVGDMIRTQAETTGFATKPAGEREAILERLRADRATPGVGTNPYREKRLAAATAMNEKVQRGIKDNPWETAQASGLIERAPVITAANATDALAIISERMKSIATVETWAGQKISPLQPQEAEQLGKYIKAMPPDQAATMLGQMGGVIGNSERVAMVARQLHDKDGTLGLAMSFANTQTSQGRNVSELVLRGDQLIKDKTVKPDGATETGWRAEITKTVRGAYANREVEDQVVNAAFLIAAAKGGDVDNAVRLATGGGVIDFNGSKVPMPVGYASDGGQSGAEEKFRKAIASVPPEQLMGQTTDGNFYAGGAAMRASEFLADLPNAQLVHAGPNLYNVKAGNSLVTNAQGRRVFIRLP